jgi:ribosomal protein S18 acetylase RimI-like enzyme
MRSAGVLDVAPELAQILELARAQRPDPQGWSLVADVDWLAGCYYASGSARLLQPLPGGGLGGCAVVSPPRSGESQMAAASSMLRPGREGLWAAQLAWIEEYIVASGAEAARIVSECLNDSEQQRWTAAGYRLVFEELAMERDLSGGIDAPSRWPDGTTLIEWGNDAASASFDVYQAAFRDRPGFPGWSRSEWIERVCGDRDFAPDASLCVLLDGVPAGFVVCDRGWVDQVGVTPEHRRGLATALVNEATSRMRADGIRTARLHVNTNNPRALATWRRLGWHVSGRRGRFERESTQVVPRIP